MPGSASAAENRVRLDFSSIARGIGAMCGKVESDPISIAATSAPADTVAAASPFLAGVDVLRRFRVEWIGIELHLALRKLALSRGLGRPYRRGTPRRDD